MNERHRSMKLTLLSPQRYRDHERSSRVRELHLQPGLVKDRVGVLFQSLEDDPAMKRPSMWKRLYQRLCRCQKPATGWEQGQAVVQELIDFMHTLKHVERLHIRCDIQKEIAGFKIDSFDIFKISMPLILAGWIAYGLTLRSLTLDFPLEAMASVLSNGQLFLPSLETLTVVAVLPDVAPIAQSTLVSFINRHSNTLQSLTITIAEDVHLPDFLSQVTLHSLTLLSLTIRLILRKLAIKSPLHADDLHGLLDVFEVSSWSLTTLYIWVSSLDMRILQRVSDKFPNLSVLSMYYSDFPALSELDGNLATYRPDNVLDRLYLYVRLRNRSFLRMFQAIPNHFPNVVALNNEPRSFFGPYEQDHLVTISSLAA
ncbi:hypothetical protein NLJ89_g6692 [Agrocybe chaxingu]|uniref:Uncharacterized protein n=1 Tax=Agrocybe chaxingu TaxID=84603 RepID=A0A9W8MVS0_9AGAR|nr:hypothetical protein NLJ89_g6692 [Agrocybe chaxingu]